MTGAAVVCLTDEAGIVSAFGADGRVWLMLLLNIIGELVRNFVLKASVMVRRTANCIKWESPELFHIKNAVLCMMKAGWMRYVQNVVKRDGNR